jgi:hypothetical protein
MNHVTAFVRAAVSVLAVTILAPRSPAQTADRYGAAEPLVLVFAEGDVPARLELRVEIDGQPLPAIWNETFAAWLALLDRDGDGLLDRAEADRLPSELALRQVLWGRFTAFTGQPPPPALLDQNADGRVNGSELARFYRRAGLGGIVVGAGTPTVTALLTDALVKHLDANSDGRVDEAEWKAADAALLKLDANDDELIGPGELVANADYPGALGSTLVKPPAPDAAPSPVADALPFFIAPRRRSRRALGPAPDYSMAGPPEHFEGRQGDARRRRKRAARRGRAHVRRGGRAARAPHRPRQAR